eukprot:scaffold62236_cov36-Phaeocystis_antarctica.AAC.1
MRRAVTRKSSLAGPPALGHPPFGHPGFATRQSTILRRPPRSPPGPESESAPGPASESEAGSGGYSTGPYHPVHSRT